MLGYSLFLFPIISETSRNSLQIIQNNCLRIIYKFKRRDISINELHTLTKMDKLDSRAKSLKERYINLAQNNHNPLIKEIYNDYVQSYNNTQKNNFSTLFDDVVMNDNLDESLLE